MKLPPFWYHAADTQSERGHLLQFMFMVLGAAARAGGSAVRDWAHRTESELVDALVQGDQDAFNWVVRKHWRSMQRVAVGLVRDESVAAEVVQEAWISVFKEIKNFRREASLRNWIYRIMVNRARRVGEKESRSVPFSRLLTRDAEGVERDPVDEFTPQGRWRSPVHGWTLSDPHDQTMNREGLELLARLLEDLPESQRVVVTMRDVEGLDSKEVCDLLQISEANQRVRLHRGRPVLRRAMARAEAKANK